MRAHLGAIGFSNDAGNTVVKKLSGGEKSGLLLRLATFEAPHLVILDVPTNHLDIDSRAALIEAINDYLSAVMLVSHNRYLLGACADRLWLVAHGSVTPFDGDLDDYRRIVLTDCGEGQTAAPKSPTQPVRSDVRRAAAKERAQMAPLRQRVAKAEPNIAHVTRQLRETDTTLAEGDLFTRDPARAADLLKRRAQIVGAIAAAEDE